MASGLTVSIILFSGCASSRSGNVYSRDQARTAHDIYLGTILSVDSVQIEGTQSGAGTVGGSVGGGFAGSTVGRGGGSVLASVAGAIAGGVAGAVTEEKVTRREGLEMTVQLDNGRTMVIVQEADEKYEVGEKVRILTGSDGTTRVRKL